MSDYAFGIVHGYTVEALFMRSLLDSLESFRAERPEVIMEQGWTSGVDRARNDVVRAFLETEAQWLFFLDTDQAFSVGDIRRVIDAADEDERPVVGGLYFQWSKHNGLLPLMFRKNAAGGMDRVTDWVPGELMQVDGIPTGFKVVHRRVYEAIWAEHFEDRRPWYKFEQDNPPKGRFIGEDLYFCEMAQEAGFPIYIETGASVGHIKRQVLGEAQYRE